MAEICVVGLGYVGLPTASLLASSGFQVLGIDINPELVSELQTGNTRLQEAGLRNLFSGAMSSGNLRVSTDVEPSNMFIICVPTPLTKDCNVDLKAVEGATTGIAGVLRKGDLVVLESTSPVGTTRNVVGQILRKSGLEPGDDFDLCYAPERVLPGNTVQELIHNDRIIGGYTPSAAERTRRLYERCCQGTISVTDDLTAELCKLVENTYRDVNIALANVVANVAEAAGVNAWEAIRLANRHPRVEVLQPGPGVGGHCIPVDPWFLVGAYPEQTDLIRQAREVNEFQPTRILNRLLDLSQGPCGNKLAILGAAYKADIDDPRESPGLALAAVAAEAGLRVAVHDPLVRGGTYQGFDVVNDIESCLEEATWAVLTTNHQAYRHLSSKIFLDHMSGRVIYDSRNWLNHDSLRLAGFRVLVCGVGEDISETYRLGRRAA